MESGSACETGLMDPLAFHREALAVAQRVVDDIDRSQFELPTPKMKVCPGLICLLVAGGVLLLWRQHRQALAELADARQEVREEAQALRELLRRTDS